MGFELRNPIVQDPVGGLQLLDRLPDRIEPEKLSHRKHPRSRVGSQINLAPNVSTEINRGR